MGLGDPGIGTTVKSGVLRIDAAGSIADHLTVSGGALEFNIGNLSYPGNVTQTGGTIGEAWRNLSIDAAGGLD